MRRMRVATVIWTLMLLVGQVAGAAAEVVGVEVLRRDPAGTHERIIARVHFAVDPAADANRAIVDLALAPTNADGLVEFASDLLMFVPVDADQARGTVFLEIVNRGRDQALGLMSDAIQRDLAPENWSLGDRFLLEQGFTVAFLGWQLDVVPAQGLTFNAPVSPVRGRVRADYVEPGGDRVYTGFRLSYCARDPEQPDALLTHRTAIDGPAQVIPRDTWQFSADGCTVIRPGGLNPGLWEAIYEAEGSPVAGLGMAAVRDFVSFLKYGEEGPPLRENPALVERVMGFGYSQSARFLRVFLRDGFNADERGRAAFDGLLISSAGAGGGSFNHRFAMPGQAGNSVLSILRPVDLPPFTDEGLLARARAADVVPRIFTTVTSTEYWARAASLTHTSEDGTADVPLEPSARLYFLAGTPHAAGPLPTLRRTATQTFRYGVNFAQQKWTLRALTVALDDWLRDGIEPPASRYPTIAAGQLVPLDALRLPEVSGQLAVPAYLPPVWRMDYGPEFATTGIMTNPRPALGDEFPVLVPQVDAIGNELGGIPLMEIAAPLGTYTGWNISLPQLTALRYLAGLLGSFVPLPRDAEAREASGDPRPSIAEIYQDREDYLGQMRVAAEVLVDQRFMLADDVDEVMAYAVRIWDIVVGR